MQWTPGPQAGFSTNPKTWLPISDSYKTTNVQTETSDADSLLNWYKSLISLRGSNTALRYGGMVMVDKGSPDVLSFVRTAPVGSQPLLIVMNMTSTAQIATVELTEIGVKPGRLHTLLSTSPKANIVSPGHIELPPYAVVIATIQ